MDTPIPLEQDVPGIVEYLKEIFIAGPTFNHTSWAGDYYRKRRKYTIDQLLSFDIQAEFPDAHRNKPCPCGSTVKAKKCCWKY